VSRLPREITTTLLLTIFGKGEVTMTQLQKETGFSTITVLNHVEEMMTANLLEERREKELPKRRFLRLSKEGLRVASMLNILTNTMFDSKTLIDLGARAGRMAAYREAISSLRPQNVTRDFAIAELLVKDLETLIDSLAIVTIALPTERGTDRENLNRMGDNLSARANEATKYLQKNDIRHAAETVSLAWKEYGSAADKIETLLTKLRERKLDELTKIIEFIAPRPAQKE
jgi:hypothetical protein